MIKKEALYHLPLSQYAQGRDENHLVIRMRVGRDDVKCVTLFYGDTACRKNPIDFFAVPMNKIASDLYFDYYEADFESRFERVYYYFLIEGEEESFYYFSDFVRHELPEDRSEYYKIPMNHRADIANIPDWVKDAVIYNIFPDSFASLEEGVKENGKEELYLCKEDGRKIACHSKIGGTIQTIKESVEYLSALGINCIYINPIFTATEYHKYDTVDYFRIDPTFGTNEEFKEMVQVLHKAGIRVLIDGVFNHCGWKFFAFEDVVRNGEKSRYKDWFYRLTFPVIRPDDPEEYPNYACFAYERLMPKLDTQNPEVRDYLCKVGAYWVREFDIDGWRLDVASELNDDFWRDFRKAVKSEKADAFIIGEVWESAAHWMMGDMFDSVMNYDCRKFSKYFFAESAIDSETFDAGVTSMLLRYKKNLQYGQLNLLDSHDVSRFLSVCKGNEKRWALAVIFQMLFLGVPSIFYGDEQGFVGEKEADYRRAMRFDPESETFRFYQRLISIRKSEECIRRGTYRCLYKEQKNGLYAFERANDKEKVIVVLNATEQKADLSQNDALSGLLGEGEVLMGEGVLKDGLDAFGYLIIKKTVNV